MKEKNSTVRCGKHAWYADAPCPYCVRTLHAIVEEKSVVSERATSRGAGLKYDGGKGQWSLMMRGMAYALGKVVDILTFGAQKYSADSWRQVENGKERYKDALYRHLNAFEQGEVLDPESGQPHLAHAACNILFLLELNREK